MKVNFKRIIIPQSGDEILGLLTKFIQCKICMNLLNDPYDCLCCNQTFCKSCIINYIKTNNKCPFSEFFDFNKKKENNNKTSNINDLLNKIKPSSSNFTKIIQSLKFYCQNKDKGCDAELNIEEITQHEKNCKYKIKKPKNELKNKINPNHSVILKNKTIKENEKEKDIIPFKEKMNSFDNINDILKNNLNNPLKHQESIVSFSGMRNILDSQEDINHFNENDINNIFNCSKIEKSIEEINQKLSYLNNYIINNFENKSFFDEDKFKSSKNIEKTIPIISKNEKMNSSQDDKIKTRNAMNITNNYYEGAFINNLNNNNSVDSNFFSPSSNTYDRDNKVIQFKDKISKFNGKEEKKDKDKDKDKKVNILSKSLNVKKENISCSQNEKEKIKNKISSKIKNKKYLKIKTERNIELNLDKDKNEKIITKTTTAKDNNNNSSNKKISFNNDILHSTPKLGSKTQKNLDDIKAFDFNLNLNIDNSITNKNSNNINNSIFCKSEEYFSNNLNEDIYNAIKSLNNKMIGIERLLQSNNSFKNQAYSIQTDDIFGDVQNDDSFTKGTISIKSSIKEIQNLKKNKGVIDIKEIEQNSKNLNEENNNNKNEKTCLNEIKKKNKEDDNILKNIEEFFEKIENNIKSILNEKFDVFKKFLEDQCIDEIKKSVLDTNFDIMTLCTEKLDEYEKVLNEKLNNIKS